VQYVKICNAIPIWHYNFCNICYRHIIPVLYPACALEQQEHPGMACTGLHVEKVTFMTHRTKICKKDCNMNDNQPDRLQQ
jgi:hypothetical protein